MVPRAAAAPEKRLQPSARAVAARRPPYPHTAKAAVAAHLLDPSVTSSANIAAAGGQRISSGRRCTPRSPVASRLDRRCAMKFDCNDTQRPRSRPLQAHGGGTRRKGATFQQEHGGAQEDAGRRR
eukprot:365306-Chlamydomonas_euryale.AAC.7